MNYQFDDVIILRINKEDKLRLKQDAFRYRMKLSAYIRFIMFKSKKL